ncbi:MAG TPA: S53 family peptidase [Jatrophihabitantaceae bacterium]|nr:S53 family peptidase [Jatrophihabitantaceae bacterium]
MKPSTLFRVVILSAACLAAAATAVAAPGQHSLLSQATDLGPVDGASPVEITVWMKLHDQPGLDAMVAAQQAGKGSYLSMEQVRAQHAPSSADVAKVEAYLKSQGFKVSAPQDNLYVKASATAARVESTFQVELHQYELYGRTFRASERGATVPPDLVPLVAAVGGLSSLGAEPQIARVGRNASSSVHTTADAEGVRPEPVRFDAQSNGLVFSAQCFYGTTTQSFSTTGVSATYTGNRYGAPITNGPPNAAPCGYQPSDLQTAYNLTQLYQHHLDGTGMTIAIVDAFGSTTIAADAAVFSAAMGLPPPNLTVIGTPTESNFSTDANAGWATETTLDVEWVHAVAPGAKIILVVAPTNSFSDLFTGIITAASQPGVVSISNSWSGFDIGVAGDSEFYNAADGILQAIGAAGMSVNFSTGDFGNNSSQLGGIYTSTGWPASSPFATGVGGVSVALDSHKHIAWQTSWGSELTEIVDTVALGSPPLDVPNNEGFDAGGTGGLSDTYPKPFWQSGVPGNRRGTPDISWVADPFTGVEIISSVDNTGQHFGIEVVGGTSVACPMFSALWGIATQRAHHLLGQAAPRLYRLSPGSGAITDIVNFTSPNNVTGTIQDAGGTNNIRASELAGPLNNQPQFVSALYNSPHSTRWFVIMFGVDSTLQTGPGWDQATGLGTPNGWNFVQAVAGGGDE